VPNHSGETSEARRAGKDCQGGNSVCGDNIKRELASSLIPETHEAGPRGCNAALVSPFRSCSLFQAEEKEREARGTAGTGTWCNHFAS
jgi:hypothetical protein